MSSQARQLRAADGACVAWHVRRPAAGAAGWPLLLIHGLASNASRFEEFVDTTSLAAHHALIRVDLRGHGRATTRRRVGIGAWCRDLRAVLQAEGGRPAVIVGHSLGAQVALHFAARHPACVMGLVLIDPVFREALHGRQRWLARAAPLWSAAAALVRALNALGLHRGPLPALDLRALDRAARVALPSPEAERAFIAQYSSARADLRHLPLAVYLQDLAEMFHAAPRPRSLPVPTLALLSSGATFADAGEMRQALAGPQVRLQEIACHHWPLTERPDAVREAIEGWCEQVLPHAALAAVPAGAELPPPAAGP
jgi:pimeloyl-ACP methyl ester carboxylesterase